MQKPAVDGDQTIVDRLKTRLQEPANIHKAPTPEEIERNIPVPGGIIAGPGASEMRNIAARMMQQDAPAAMSALESGAAKFRAALANKTEDPEMYSKMITQLKAMYLGK